MGPADISFRRSAVLALLLLLLLGHTSVRAAVPNDLTNFNSEYPCPSEVLVVRPRTIADVQRAVQLHAHIQSNGEGHSWNQPFFCAAPPTGTSAAADAAPAVLAADGPSANASAPSAEAAAAAPPTSANIVLTTIRPLTIQVNESAPSVWVDAGVKVVDLLRYLGNYVTDVAPAGWTLPAFPWFVYQSVGGAVATGTHGSSLPWASLSHQVLALDVVLADGTRRVFTPETDPFLMRALRVSVGRLGVIVRVQLRIVPETAVERQLRELDPPAFLALLREAQDEWNSNATLPTSLNETEFFWITQTYKFFSVSFQRLDALSDAAAQSSLLAAFKPDNTTRFNNRTAPLSTGELLVPSDAPSIHGLQPREGATPATSQLDPAAAQYLQQLRAAALEARSPDASSAVEPPPPPGGKEAGGDEAARGSVWTPPRPHPQQALLAAENTAAGYLAVSDVGIRFVAGNNTLESHQAYIKQPEATLNQLHTTPFDQYEVSIPVSTMADCMEALLQQVYGDDLTGADPTQRKSDKGFRTAPLIRFVGAEEGLLSQTGDVPRMFINIEDYVFFHSGRRINQRFHRVMGLLTGDPRCSSAERGIARLHWGKAGWPDPGCWHGDKVYGVDWCHFGCAVQQLDPSGKFRDSAADRWTWRGVDLQACCTPDGFAAATNSTCVCRVEHARPMQACPPAPFYSTR